MTHVLIEKWRQFGVQLDKTETTDEKLNLYISVPNTSDFFDGNGNELSGNLLAKRVKQSVGDQAVVRFRIRHEHWIPGMEAGVEPAPPPKQEASKYSADDFVRDCRNWQRKHEDDNLKAFFNGLFGGK